MTAEICIMSRHDAVLAADSAITATRFVGNRQRERYHKGANKIFQLSEHEPVALMLHGTDQPSLGGPGKIFVEHR
jgi:hypothetical protein